MSTLFVVDIDDTLADMRDVLASAGPEPDRKTDKEAHGRWLSVVVDPAALAAAQPVYGITDLVWNLTLGRAEYVFLTARNEKFRDVTAAWLHKYCCMYATKAKLFMRPQSSEDASESSGAFKEWAIRFLAGGFDNVVVIDDDPNGGLEAVCKRNGWTLLKAFIASKESA